MHYGTTVCMYHLGVNVYSNCELFMATSLAKGYIVTGVYMYERLLQVAHTLWVVAISACSCLPKLHFTAMHVATL